MKKTQKPRRFEARLVVAGILAGGCGLLACSAGANPPLATSEDGIVDGGNVDGTLIGRGTADASSSQESGDAGDATGSAAADAREAAGETGVADAPYALIDVASLPDALGLDAFAPCDFLSCSPGCCQSGVCVPGTDPAACGGSGNACVDCTKTSQTCNPGTTECQ
jgi:hypothetical protein